ncbi:MAG: IPExxxVDY family protein [Bacteroidales bacterium]|nr:IPExxxVDY family protein [Lentimicrobiaceae bacterium]MDD5693825.1 IPExxxVDY family protein [Bacteroidales bacterium]
MAKKYHLEQSREKHQPVFIGIACRSKDYQLCFHINKKLDLHLRKLPDLRIVFPGQFEACSYSLYRHQDASRRLDYILLSNHHPDSKLIPEFKQTDYFLMVAGETTATEIEKTIFALRSVPGVLLAYYLDLSRTKLLDVILADLELHLLITDKKG